MSGRTKQAGCPLPPHCTHPTIAIAYACRPAPLLLSLALALGLGAFVDAKAAPGSFTLAPRSNATTEPSLGCGVAVNWPGSSFAGNEWTYAQYDCKDYWTYQYTINVTAQPSGFALDAVSAGFRQSSVTLWNTGTCAGFDYKVTMECPLMGLSALSCNGTLEPNGPSRADCNMPTVPNQWVCPWDYTAVIQIHNRNWVCAAEGTISVYQTCNNGAPAGADLCSNGTFYGFLDTASPTPLLGYVTGGCVSDMAPGARCGGATFCCPNGQYPYSTTSCGTGDGTYNTTCYDCTGGC